MGHTAREGGNFPAPWAVSRYSVRPSWTLSSREVDPEDGEQRANQIAPTGTHWPNNHNGEACQPLRRFTLSALASADLNYLTLLSPLSKWSHCTGLYLYFTALSHPPPRAGAVPSASVGKGVPRLAPRASERSLLGARGCDSHCRLLTQIHGQTGASPRLHSVRERLLYVSEYCVCVCVSALCVCVRVSECVHVFTCVTALCVCV